MTPTLAEEIESLLKQQLPSGSEVQVLDPHQDGQHFEAIVISPA